MQTISALRQTCQWAGCSPRLVGRSKASSYSTGRNRALAQDRHATQRPPSAHRRWFCCNPPIRASSPTSGPGPRRAQFERGAAPAAAMDRDPARHLKGGSGRGYQWPACLAGPTGGPLAGRAPMATQTRPNDAGGPGRRRMERTVTIIEPEEPQVWRCPAILLHAGGIAECKHERRSSLSQRLQPRRCRAGRTFRPSAQAA